MRKKQWHMKLKKKKEESAWLIYNQGDEQEFAECSKCGHEIVKNAYGHMHSMPMVCPKCRERIYINRVLS